MAFEINMTGLDDVLKAIDDLPRELGAKVLQDIAANAARKIVINNLKDNAPNFKTHSVSKALRVVKTGYSSGIGSRVAIDRKKGYFLRWYELGTVQRFTKGKGKRKTRANRGVMPSKPFIGPAFARSGPQVIQYLQQNIYKVAMRTIKRRLKSI
jgi:hypothetical protein